MSEIIPLYPIPEPLEGDVFLCSYPKSGRTWVRQFLAQYMSLVYDLGYTERYDLMKLMTIVPAEWFLITTNQKCFAYADRIPRVRCTHFLPDERFEGKPVIWLTRGIEDTLVSFYHHEQRTENMSQFVRGRVHEIVFYYKMWNRLLHIGDWLQFSYEDLHGDPCRWFKAIVNFVKLPWDENHFDTALERSSFSSMRRDQEGTKIERVRRGVVGGHRDELEQADIEYIQDIVKI